MNEEIELTQPINNESESSSHSHRSNQSSSNKDWYNPKTKAETRNEEIEEAYYLATLCLKFQNFEDALTYVDEIIKKKNSELTQGERNIFVGAYEYFLYQKRVSWRNIHAKETNDQKMKLILNEIKSNIEDVIIKTCERVINVINKNILHFTKSDDGITVMLRLKADSYRYMAEITHSQALYKNKQNALNFYMQAYNLSQKLDDLDSIKLTISMNFSVFLYEILNQRVNAIFYAKGAINKALVKLKDFSDEELKEESMKESLTIIEILSKNLHQWYAEEFEGSVNKTN